MCYGPVVADGYGVCYNPRAHDIIVCITAFKSYAETQSDYFALTLEGSLLQMQELCKKTTEDFENVADKLRNATVANSVSPMNTREVIDTSTVDECVLHGNGQVQTPKE